MLTGKYSYDEQRPVGSRFDILHGTNRQTYDKWYWHEDQLSLISNLKDYFAKRGKSMTQVALAWVLANPLITAPIVGASSVEQLQQSLPQLFGYASELLVMDHYRPFFLLNISSVGEQRTTPQLIVAYAPLKDTMWLSLSLVELASQTRA